MQGGSFEAGARAEREKELMDRVSDDLQEMEHFMHKGGRRGHRESRGRRMARERRYHDDEDVASFLPKALRKGLKDDMGRVGDRLVPVTGKPVNLDMI